MDKFIYAGLATAGVLVVIEIGHNLYIKHIIKETTDRIKERYK